MHSDSPFYVVAVIVVINQSFNFKAVCSCIFIPYSEESFYLHVLNTYISWISTEMLTKRISSVAAEHNN